MITRCDEGILAAIRCDVPACIVALVKQALEPQFSGSAGANMRCSCAECLAQMSHHVDGKARMREAGAIDVLTQLLKAQVRAVPTNDFVSALMSVRSSLVAILAKISLRSPNPKKCYVL